MQVVTQEWVEAQRARRYRRTPALRIETVQEAQAFVDEMGFCHFWPIKDIEMPNLFHAIAGRVRAVPNAHNDPDLSKCWGWKDSSLGKKWWYYGKVLRKRATMISMAVLPYFYACSENYGELDDYLQEYRAGTMTAEAKAIYEALLKHGALDTLRLRREARLNAESAKSRFERALVELQVGFKVMPIGVADAGAWHYAFVYEILQRHLPEIPSLARPIRRAAARRFLVQRYVDNTIAIEPAMIRKVFYHLDWTKTELNRAIDALLKEGTICPIQIKDVQDTHLGSARALTDGG